MVRFAYTILYVENVSVAIAFYEKAFGFTRRFVTPENEYGEMDMEGTVLSFASWVQADTNLTHGFTQSSMAHKPFGIELCFTVDDVEEAFNRAVAAGACPLEKAAFKAHGQTVAYVRDPNGFLIELCTPM